MPPATPAPTLGRRRTARERAAGRPVLRDGWRTALRARVDAAPRVVDAARPRLAGGVRPAIAITVAG